MTRQQLIQQTVRDLEDQGASPAEARKHALELVQIVDLVVIDENGVEHLDIGGPALCDEATEPKKGRR